MALESSSQVMGDTATSGMRFSVRGSSVGLLAMSSTILASQVSGLHPIPLYLIVTGLLFLLVCASIFPLAGEVLPFRNLALALSSVVFWIGLHPIGSLLALGIAIIWLQLWVKDPKLQSIIASCGIASLCVAAFDEVAAFPSLSALITQHLPTWYLTYQGTNDQSLPLEVPLAPFVYLLSVLLLTIANHRKAQWQILGAITFCLLVSGMVAPSLLLGSVFLGFAVLALTAMSGFLSLDWHRYSPRVTAALGIPATLILFVQASDSTEARPRRTVVALSSQSMNFRVWNADSGSPGEIQHLVSEPNFHSFLNQIAQMSEDGIASEAAIPMELSQASAVVMINPSLRLEEDTISILLKYIDDGGRILVLADHTNLDYQADCINPLLLHLGIQICNDSAIPNDAAWSWKGRTRFLRDPVLNGLAPSHAPISIGCSLRLTGDAVPIILGTDGFSDAADVSKNDGNFFGDAKWSAPEPAGVLVLAARSRHGRGEVLVFGDTSPFQNLSSSRGHAIQRRLAEWAVGKPPPFLKEVLLWPVAYFLGILMLVVQWSTASKSFIVVPVMSGWLLYGQAQAVVPHVLIWNGGKGAAGYKPREARSISTLAELLSAHGVVTLIDSPQDVTELTLCVIRSVMPHEWRGFDLDDYRTLLTRGGSLVLFVSGLPHRPWEGGNDQLELAIVNQIVEGPPKWANPSDASSAIDVHGFPLRGDLWTPILSISDHIVGMNRPWLHGQVWVYSIDSPFMKGQSRLTLGEWNLLAASVHQWLGITSQNGESR